MRTLLYSYKSGVVNNRLGLALAGVITPRTITCPPYSARSFPYHTMSSFDLLYIVMHDGPDPNTLYGDEFPEKHDHRRHKAMDAERIQSFQGIVLLEGCAGMKTQFPKAFLIAGAKAVIASDRPTWDKTVWLGPAGWEGARIVRGIRNGRSVESSVSGSKIFLWVGDGEAKA